jgi:hypothetical protein
MEAYCQHNPSGNPYWCNAIWGYCQFQISSMVNEYCPIYNAYPKYPIHIDEEIDDETLQKYSYATIYDKDDRLVSLGDTAYQNYPDELELEIPYVRYIGKNAFTNCLKLKTLDFSKKTDDKIPVLASITAFMKSDGENPVNDYFSILVPKSLEDTWKSSLNWVVFKDHIVGV